MIQGASDCPLLLRRRNGKEKNMGTYNVHGGHNSIVPGANKYLNEVTEDRSVKNKVISYLKAAGHTVYDCTDDSGTTQGANLSNIVSKCNAHIVDLDISIHLNAGGGTGTEVLYYPESAEGQTMAAKVSAKIASAFGWKDRGAKGRSDLYVLKNTKAVAILVECCFVDSQSDAQKWDADKCAKAIAEAVTGKAVSAGSSSGASGASKPSSSGSGSTGGTSYYKAFSSTSIVDGLKSIRADSSMSNRKKIAAANGISNYTGTAEQNTKLLSLAKQGKLKKAGSSSGSSSSGTSYYKKFSSTSIVDGLKSIGVDSSFANRKKIAKANGISNYEGSASQNNKLCSLAKQGKLKKV